jgi:hypothetical protein
LTFWRPRPLEWTAYSTRDYTDRDQLIMTHIDDDVSDPAEGTGTKPDADTCMDPISWFVLMLMVWCLEFLSQERELKISIA